VFPKVSTREGYTGVYWFNLQKIEYMNKTLLSLNIILLAAVAVLLFLFISNKPGGFISGKKKNETDSSLLPQKFRVAYFDMDSIEANFSLFRQMQKDVSKKEDSMNSVLNSARMNLQSRYRKFQEQRATMTPEDMEKAGNELSRMDMEIKNSEQNLSQSFQSYYMNKQQEVISHIKKYCLEYNKEKGYSFIIANEPGLIYYKDTTYNITSDLLKGLNSQFEKQHKKE
jgi:outer membrane protein